MSGWEKLPMSPYIFFCNKLRFKRASHKGYLIHGAQISWDS